VVAVASFFYSLPLIALMGMGVLLDVVMGLPFIWGVLIGAVISLIYTLMGGLLADAFTDTIQFTLMCVTLGIAAVLVLDKVGGVDRLPELLPASYFDPQGTYPAPVLAVFAMGALSIFVEPAIYQRIFAATSKRAIFAALAIGLVLWSSYDWITALLGMAAQASGLVVEPRYALLTVVVDALPPGLTGLFVAGVIATGMSTVDSYLLIAGGNLSYDLYRPFVNPGMDDAGLLRLTRWAIVVACVISVGFALFFASMVSAWVFMAAMLVGAAFVPVSAALFAQRRLKPAAGLASSLVGFAAVTGVYVAVNVYGVESEQWGTVIWTVQAWGRSFEIWQEYAVLFALPASAMAFIMGQILGRPWPTAMPQGGAGS